MVLDDLQQRLEKTRFTTGMDGAGWDHGASPSYVEQLCDYWRYGNFDQLMIDLPDGHA